MATYKAEKNRYFFIDTVKLFLILGVVSIHSNVLTSNEDDYLPSLGSNIEIFLSSTLTRICVPAFFIISGFLFYLNINNFNLSTYKSKIYRRFYTLFIPYILWNLISLFIQIIKIKYLGFPDHGLFEDGSIQWIRIFEGFYDYVDGYPFAFAFWFIRNLMIFVVLSPIAYLLGCKQLYIGIIFVIICWICDTTLWGFCFFVIGGMGARYLKNQLFQIPISVSLISGILWISISIINLFTQFDFLYSAILVIDSIAALLFIIFMVKYLSKTERLENIINKLVPATFFIYSFHQLFCTGMRNLYIKIWGLTTSIGIILSYLFSFITLVGLSYIIWQILKWGCPSILNILCGNRGLSFNYSHHKTLVKG